MINVKRYEKMSQGVKDAIYTMLDIELESMSIRHSDVASGKVSRKIYNLGISDTTVLSVEDIKKIMYA